MSVDWINKLSGVLGLIITKVFLTFFHLALNVSIPLGNDNLSLPGWHEHSLKASLPRLTQTGTELQSVSHVILVLIVILKPHFQFQAP